MPHKLQAEARSRKRVGRRPAVYGPGKPMAETFSVTIVSGQPGTDRVDRRHFRPDTSRTRPGNVFEVTGC